MKKIVLSLLAIVVVLINSCSYDQTPQPAETNYPANIERILMTRCAVTGCHEAQSKEGTDGLSFATYDELFEGSHSGSVVIPFSKYQSTLMYFVNRYHDLDTIYLEPLMPYNRGKLSHADVETLYKWIEAGAPDKNGNIKFCCDANRKKFYVANQACDLVAVFDAQTKLIMRYVSVGVDPNTTEAPHEIKISPDGQYWYVVLYFGNVIQKFRASDDSYVGAIQINVNHISSSPNWNVITFSSDSKKAWVSDFSGGIISFVDLVNDTEITAYSPFCSNPHGLCIKNDMSVLYITAQGENNYYKIDAADFLTGDYTQHSLGTSSITPMGPHQIAFSPDETKYFVTCANSNEVRVFDASNDNLIQTISVGITPQEMSFSANPATPYLFVTCKEDSLVWGTTQKRGSVWVINYNNLSIVKNNIYSGFQPHGISVDDDKHLVYVANLNYDQNGPTPHHVGSCGGRNGYVTIIDLNTLEMLPAYKAEVLPFPYSVAYKK